MYKSGSVLENEMHNKIFLDFEIQIIIIMSRRQHGSP